MDHWGRSLFNATQGEITWSVTILVILMGSIIYILPEKFQNLKEPKRKEIQKRSRIAWFN